VKGANNSFSFKIIIDLQYYESGNREYYIFYTTWLAKTERVGNYNINVSAAINHSIVNLVHPNFALREDHANVAIVSGAPTINSLDVTNRSHSLGLNDLEWYVLPGKDVEVRCQVTCLTGVQKATLYYSVWPSSNESSIAMTMESHSEWIGFIPMQQEETLIFFRVEAFSSTESAIKKGDKPCRFLDLGRVEHKATIDVAITLTAASVGCAIFFAVKKHRMSEL